MSADEALADFLRLLKQRDYRFTTVTPATHARVLARPCGQPDLRDIFGWNRPFDPQHLDPDLLECLQRSDMLDQSGAQLRSRIRVASLEDHLFLHSRFPTDEADAVFFGPDTYRFARFIREQMRGRDRQSIVDMGTGSGAGAILAASLAPNAEVTGIDINAQALRLAAINARAAGAHMATLQSSEVPRGADLVLANPPYIMDSASRAYRDGGALLGGQLALEWVKQALDAMRPGGTMLLYTGAPVVEGRAPLIEALHDACPNLALEEIDPDVFGEELDQPPYAKVERIALITAVIRKP